MRIASAIPAMVIRVASLIHLPPRMRFKAARFWYAENGSGSVNVPPVRKAFFAFRRALSASFPARVFGCCFTIAFLCFRFRF